MDKIRELLNEEIEREITAIKDLDAKEKDSAINRVVNLYNLKIEEDKVLIDHSEKKNQLEEQVRDRYFKVGLEAGIVILELTCYGIWMRRGFKFEETGTYTSKTFMGLINRFKPAGK